MAKMVSLSPLARDLQAWQFDYFEPSFIKRKPYEARRGFSWEVVKLLK